MRFFSDERGQSLIFAAVTLFAVATFVGLVYNVGNVTADRVQIQHAADAAAYSGALAQADVMSALAWLNEGMAYIYYNGMRYAVDTCVTGTLAELTDLGASDDVVGVSNPVGRYMTAYAKAKEWIPRSEEYLKQINDMEDAIALAAPALVKKEIWRAATENGAEKVAMFPDLEYFPDPAAYQEIQIEDLGGGSWRLTVVAGIYEGYVLTIERLGPSDWKITCTDGLTTTWVEVQEISPGYYKVTTSQGRWFTFRQTGSDRVDIVTSDGYTVTSIHTDNGWITSGSSGTETVTVTPQADGSFIIQSSHGTVHIRSTPDGGFEQNTGSGWVAVPAPDSVTVDGRDFPVSFTNHIKIGTGPGAITVWVPSTIWVGNIRYDLPNTVTVGPARLTLLKDAIALLASFGPAQVSIANGKFGVGHNDYILHEGAEDDSVWRGPPRGDWRHRLSIPESNSWTYQYQKEAAYLSRDNAERFSETHAIRDNDAYANAHNGQLPDWTRWFDPKIGKPISGTDYHQTRICWNVKDLNCPYHGTDPGTEPNGYWHEGRGIDVVRVECPLCKGMHYDNDPRTQVRVYLEDAFSRAGGPGLDAEDHMAVDITKFQRPLVLSESLFKYGVNVGVWKSKPQIPLAVGLTSGAPRWGYVAFACAKAGFYDVTEKATKYQFDNSDERSRWLDSFANLYEPSWSSKLWPVRTALLDEDIDAVMDPATGETIQKGLNYLLFKLKQSYWFKTYEEAIGGPRGDWRVGRLGEAPPDLSAITAPADWGGQPLNLETGRTLDEVIRH